MTPYDLLCPITGCLSLAPSLSPFRGPVSGSSVCHFSFPQPESPGLSGLGSLTLHTASSASTLSSVLHIQVRRRISSKETSLQFLLAPSRAQGVVLSVCPSARLTSLSSLRAYFRQSLKLLVLLKDKDCPAQVDSCENLLFIFLNPRRQILAAMTFTRQCF